MNWFHCYDQVCLVWSIRFFTMSKSYRSVRFKMLYLAIIKIQILQIFYKKFTFRSVRSGRNVYREKLKCLVSQQIKLVSCWHSSYWNVSSRFPTNLPTHTVDIKLMFCNYFTSKSLVVHFCFAAYRIHTSETFKNAIDKVGDYELEHRGTIQVKVSKKQKHCRQMY